MSVRQAKLQIVMKLSQTQENKNEQCKKNIDPELTENGIRVSYTEQTVGMPEALICQGVTEGGSVFFRHVHC